MFHVLQSRQPVYSFHVHCIRKLPQYLGGSNKLAEDASCHDDIGYHMPPVGEHRCVSDIPFAPPRLNTGTFIDNVVQTRYQ